MRELEVGDNVWIRDDLVDGKTYGMQIWSKNKRKGMSVTIEHIFYSSTGLFEFTIEEDYTKYGYSIEMVDWDKTDEYNRNKIDPNIIKYKEIFDQFIEVGFTREETLKIMINAGNVGKNT